VLQKTAYTFDASLVEIFRWSLTGAKGYLLSPGDEKDPYRTCEEIYVQGVTEMQVVPSMLKIMIIAVKNDMEKYAPMLSSLRYVFTGGEAITVDVVDDFYEVFGKYNKEVALINTYGPTETSIEATHYHLRAGEDKVLIGKPVGNYQGYILAGTSLCGIGMIGELCFAGKGVARGYLNSEEMTQMKFIDNPFGDGKLYRTGDAARWLADGNIECLGRIDEQVKIRGFRIELGEIETVLRTIEGVVDAVAVVHIDEGGDKTLCVYIQSMEPLEVEYLKAQLKNYLPDYMIPGHFMRIDKIPLTGNGKLNKRALPEMEITTATVYVAPTTETERIIVSIFEEMFKVPKIGIKESFFELGGDSLKATLLVNRLEEETGVRLGIKEIFQGLNAEGISIALENLEGNYQPIPKAEEKEHYPMSPAQRRLFVLNQIEEESIAYNMPVALTIRGKLDISQMKAAFNKLIKRHETLRTSFGLVGMEPVQYIHEDIGINLIYKEPKVEIGKEQVLEAFVRPFDLSKAPLIRAELLKVENESYVLLIDMHHIISDGISTEILISDLLSLYAGEELPKLQVQYKDYSRWLLTRDLEEQKNYWIEKFEDEIPVLELPRDYPRPMIQSFEGETLVKKLDSRLKEQVLILSERTGATNYMVMLGLFMVLLGKYSNQEDVVVGTPISGRTHRDTENIMGMFVNTLVMRGRPAKEKNLIQFIEEMKITCLQAYENQEYPFEELVESLNLPRDMSRNPLFDVMFSYETNMERSSVVINDISFEVMENEDVETISKFDLSLTIREVGDGFEAAFEYCSDLFMAETIELMAERFILLLEQAVEQSENQLSEIEIIVESERQQILTDFNGTKMAYPEDKTVVCLFEEQVAKAPDNIAMTFEGQSLTYGELNVKANAIAIRLRDMGIRPGDYVAMMTRRSMELVIGIYGVIKSGGAYVPIDVDCPKQRLSYMLKDCNAKAMLVYGVELDEFELDIPIIDLGDKSVIQELLYQRLANDGLKEVNCSHTAKEIGISLPSVDSADEKDQSLPDFNATKEIGINLPNVNSAEDDFYLIYTSGTTGEPKGVMCQHKGTVNLITYLQQNYPIDNDSTVLQKTAYTFDASLVEIFRWSLTGAKGHLLSPGDEKDPYRMCEEIYEHGVTEMQVVPSMLKIMIVAVKSDIDKYAPMLKSLKYVFTGGEAITVDVVDDFYEVFGKYNKEVALINTYGPTETSIEATHYHLRAGEDKVSIGKPVGNYQGYILDGTSLCSIGMIGELCFAGVGVARGYLNNDDITSEKFIDNPFGEGKLYRTGDAARWLADGNIEYLGRIDEQVKIRGFRIELGEIESVLRTIEGVIDAVVIVQADKDGDKILCAYIQSEEPLGESLKEPLGESLEEFLEEPLEEPLVKPLEKPLKVEYIITMLRKHLPEYMIPHHFMRIPSIPLTSSGKVNKRALPNIEIITTTEYVAPTTKNEIIIAHVFKEMFESDKIGIKDSFFELGGNSLKATLLVNRIEQETGVRLGIKDVFLGVSVEGISLALENLEGLYEPIPKAKEKEYYQISPAQEMFFSTSNLWDNNGVDLTSNVSVALRVAGTYEAEQVEYTFDALIRRYEILRTSFHLIDDITVMRIHDKVKLDLTYEEDYSEENFERFSREAFGPIDITIAPLMRVKVIEVGKEEAVILMNFHHIITDGISSDIFFRELMTIYTGDKLPPPRLQYRDYSEWALNRPLDKQKEYWMNHFAEGIPKRLELPEDYPRPKKKKYNADVVTKILDKNLTNKVIDLGKKMDMTPYMTWLSMMMILFSNYCSEEGVVLGSTVSGRTHRDTEDMQGMFINRILLAGKPEKEKPLYQFLEEVKEECLMALENQDVSLATFIEEFEPEAHLDSSKSPIYDVHYLFLEDEGNSLSEIEIDGLQIQSERPRYTDTNVKFDLVCKVAENGDEYTLIFLYSTDLFKKKTIEGFTEQLTQVLEQLEERKNQTIGELIPEI
jgi:amino acid adenylation domain-containing protein